MAENPFLELDRKMVGDIHTSSEAMENMEVLCDDFGSRFGGTRGERQAAAFFRDKYNSMIKFFSVASGRDFACP